MKALQGNATGKASELSECQDQSANARLWLSFSCLFLKGFCRPECSGMKDSFEELREKKKHLLLGQHVCRTKLPPKNV